MINKSKKQTLSCLLSSSIFLGSLGVLGYAIRDEIKPAINRLTGEKTFDIYKNNIEYQNLSDIDFTSLPKKEIRLPYDLEYKIFYSFLNQPTVSDEHKLEEMIFDEANKLGYTKDKITKLPAKSLIQLCADIIASRFKYHLVDNDRDFIAEHGSFLHLEKYFELGLGDCDKYSDAFTFTFRTMKKINPNLTNVYASSCALTDWGGNILPHQWNAIITVTTDKIIISHIDPTFYDAGNKLEAEIGYHVPEDKLEFLDRFYQDLSF